MPLQAFEEGMADERVAAVVQRVPVSGGNLRQRIEDDRTPGPVPAPRVVPNDADPRERQVRAPAAAPEVYVHQRVLGLG